jgi:hypothetical protein
VVDYRIPLSEGPGFLPALALAAIPECRAGIYALVIQLGDAMFADRLTRWKP